MNIIFFRPKDISRIEFLLKEYLKLRGNFSEQDTKYVILGYWKTRNGILANLYGYSEASIKRKDELVEELFGFNPSKADIRECIGRIVSWEFPGKYNKFPSIQEIRQGRDVQTKLTEKINQIADRLGA